MKLVLAFYVTVGVLGGTGANGFLHTLTNWWPFHTQDAESTDSSDVQVLLGVPDTVASVGRLFSHKIPDYAFQGDVAQITAHVTGSRELPDWMYLNETSHTLTGIPGVVDTGSIIIQVEALSRSEQSASTSFLLQVRATSQYRHTDTPSFKSRDAHDLICDWFEQTITATVVLNTDLRKLNAQQRVELVHTWANYVSLSVQGVTLHARRTQGGFASVTDGKVLTAGPGDADLGTSHKGVELTWTIACGDFTGRDDVTMVLEHNIDNGNLRAVLGYSIIGWFVSEILPVGGVQVLRRKRQIQGFATPIPTPTVSTVSPTMLSPDPTSPHPSMTVHPSPSVTPSASVSITLTSTVTTTVTMSSTSTHASMTSHEITEDFTDNVIDATTSSLLSTREIVTSGESTILAEDTTISSDTIDMTTSDMTTASDVTSDVTTDNDLTNDVTTADDAISDVTTADDATSDVTTANDATSDMTTANDVTSDVTTASDLTSGADFTDTPTVTETNFVSTPLLSTTQIGTGIVTSPILDTTEVSTALTSDSVGTTNDFSTDTSLETTLESGITTDNQDSTSAGTSTDTVTAGTVEATETVSLSIDVSTILSGTENSTEDVTTESQINATIEAVSPEFNGTTDITPVTEHVYENQTITTGLPSVTSSITSVPNITTDGTDVTTENGLNASDTQTTGIGATTESSPTIDSVTNVLSSPATTQFDQTTATTPLHASETSELTTLPSDTSSFDDITTLLTPLQTDITTSEVPTVITIEDVTTQQTEGALTVTESRSSGTSKRSATTELSTSPTLTDAREFTSEMQTTESVDVTTTEYLNQPPEVVMPIPRLPTFLGTYFSYVIPNNTFFDPEDGNTRSLTLQFFKSSLHIIEPEDWFQLDPILQRIYGVAVTSKSETRTSDLLLDTGLLYAIDGAGLNVSTEVELSIDPSLVINVSHQFVIRMAVPLSVLYERTDGIVEISNGISLFYNDTDYGFVTITHIRNLNNTAIQFIWTNNTISKQYCYNNTILNLYSHLASDIDLLQTYFTNKYPITSVSLEWLGACSAETYVPPPRTVTGKSKDDSEGLPLWAIILIVVIILLFLLTFIILLICCILSRKKEGGRYIPTDEKPIFSNKRKPVILEGEIEMQDSPVRKPRKPMVLDSDLEAPFSFTNPAYSGPYESRRQPPAYEGGAGIEDPDSFSDEPLPMEIETDYPAVYEPDPYRRPPPAYRLPPPYLERSGYSEI